MTTREKLNDVAELLMGATGIPADADLKMPIGLRIQREKKAVVDALSIVRVLQVELERSKLEPAQTQPLTDAQIRAGALSAWREHLIKGNQ